VTTCPCDELTDSQVDTLDSFLAAMCCFHVSAAGKDSHARLTQDADRSRSEQHAGTVEHCGQVSNGKKV